MLLLQPPGLWYKGCVQQASSNWHASLSLSPARRTLQVSAPGDEAPPRHGRGERRRSRRRQQQQRVCEHLRGLRCAQQRWVVWGSPGLHVRSMAVCGCPRHRNTPHVCRRCHLTQLLCVLLHACTAKTKGIYDLFGAEALKSGADGGWVVGDSQQAVERRHRPTTHMCIRRCCTCAHAVLNAQAVLAMPLTQRQGRAPCLRASLAQPTPTRRCQVRSGGRRRAALHAQHMRYTTRAGVQCPCADACACCTRTALSAHFEKLTTEAKQQPGKPQEVRLPVNAVGGVRLPDTGASARVTATT